MFKKTRGRTYTLEPKKTSKSNEFDVTMKDDGHAISSVTVVATSASTAYFNESNQKSDKDKKKIS